MTGRGLISKAAPLLLCVMLAACTTSPPARLYALTPLAESSGGAAPVGERRLVGIGPVDIPYYLDRNQILTRQTRYRFGLSEIDQWAEPIGDNIAGVVARNLAVLVPGSHPLVDPWVDAPVYRQVVIKVSQFHADADGEIRLVASWAIVEPASNRFLAVDESNIQLAAQPPELENVLAGMSRALQRLSEDIAGALRAEW